MHTSAQKEQFSVAYVHAVAAAAGFNMFGHWEVDDDSVDVQFKAPGQTGPVRRLNLALQLKCTQNLTGDDHHWSFRLSRKNYDDLTDETIHIPPLLVVLHVPESTDDWLVHGEDDVTLRRRAYWLSLKGRGPLPAGQQSTTVHIPRKNVFDVPGLLSIAERRARGEI